MPLNNAQIAKAHEIARGLCKGTHILASDYDGTLAPFVSDPKQAKMAVSAKNALKQLHALVPENIMIITGRTLDELQMLLTISLEATDNDNGFTQINAIGSQGFARRVNHQITENPFSEQEKIFLEIVKNDAKKLCHTWIRVLNSEYGLNLELKNLYEEKGQSFGLHWRVVEEKLTDHADKNILIDRIATEYHALLTDHYQSYENKFFNNNTLSSWAMPRYQVHQAAEMFEILEGNMVYEFKLRRVSKGAALIQVLALENFSDKVVVFLGDDYNDGKGTDASAAKVIKNLNNGGIVIQVIDGNKAQAAYAHADMQIHTQHGMGEFLQEVVNHYQLLLQTQVTAKM